MHEHPRGHPDFPCCKGVAHGGTGAGPSGADADDEVVNRIGDLFEFHGLQRSPGVALVRAFDLRRLAQIFKLALEERPESAGDGILVPYESDTPAHRGVQGAALRLKLNSRIANRID